MIGARRVASWLAGIVLAALLAGCAGPRYMDMAESLPPLKTGDGRIVFYMPEGSGAGPSGQPKIRVNQQVVGRAKPGSFFFVDRPAGSYVVTDKLWTGDGLSFMLNAGETRYVRFAASSLGSTGVGKLNVDLIDSQAEAQQQLIGLRYWGAAPSTQLQ